jgi:hypothetical protein
MRAQARLGVEAWSAVAGKRQSLHRKVMRKFMLILLKIDLSAAVARQNQPTSKTETSTR